MAGVEADREADRGVDREIPYPYLISLSIRPYR